VFFVPLCFVCSGLRRIMPRFALAQRRFVLAMRRHPSFCEL
jgi:hypothetical protein